MRLKSIIALLACVLLVAGCSTLGSSKKAGETGESGENLVTGIPLAPDFRIADIPIPADFEFDRDHSFVFQNSQMDVGRIQYIGKAPIEEVAQFYLDEMAQYNWTLLSVTEHGTITLFFEKPGKSSQVVLSKKGRGTLVYVSFFPKPTKSQAEY